jgi:hypothetical protein
MCILRTEGTLRIKMTSMCKLQYVHCMYLLTLSFNPLSWLLAYTESCRQLFPILYIKLQALYIVQKLLIPDPAFTVISDSELVGSTFPNIVSLKLQELSL